MSAKCKEVIIIGAGFYGLSLALYLRGELGYDKITVLEKEAAAMERSSYVNQARVHNGYHYPRSILTGYRSAVNFPRFIQDYRGAICSDFKKYYAIARKLSKVSARQFELFCEKIKVECSEISDDNIRNIFDYSMIEKAFAVKEYAFDSRILREILLGRIQDMGNINIRYSVNVESIAFKHEMITVKTSEEKLSAEVVLNCTYSNLNALHRNSNLSLMNLKHEVTEMCLVSLPPELDDIAVTVMDGPFFSLMPFPSKKLYSLSHVRYTPHLSWLDEASSEPDKRRPHKYLQSLELSSNFQQMKNDVVRFMPILHKMEYVESIYETKTVLTKSENDDSRPILFRNDFGNNKYICIMGGKLDNIYDVYDEIKGVL